MKKLSLILGLLRIPVDAATVLLALISSYYLRYQTEVNLGRPVSEVDQISLSEFLGQTYWMGVLALFVLLATGLYRLKGKQGLLHQVGKIALAGVLTFMAIISYYFFIRGFPVSRLAVIYLPLLIFIYVTLGRSSLYLIDRKLKAKGHGRRKILLLGSNKTAFRMAKALKSNNNYELVGYLADRPFKHKVAKWRGKYKDLEKIVRKHKIEEVVQATTARELDPNHCLTFCRFQHLEYYYIPTSFALHEHAFEFQDLKGIPWLKLQRTPLDGWGRILKRGFDLLLTIPALIVLAPFFILVAIAIKLDSKGTVFYKYLDDGSISKRIGYEGKPFYCYKFRTMRSKTHQLRYEKLAGKNQRKGPVVKIKDDPRITRVGKWLRRFDIDELPQLINVLIGNMSLVGPRPHLPEEVAKYDDHHRFVLTIKPGITGFAQVNGRSQLSFEDEVRLDSFYIEHWGLWLDLKIIIKTIPVVLFKTSD